MRLQVFATEAVLCSIVTAAVIDKRYMINDPIPSPGTPENFELFASHENQDSLESIYHSLNETRVAQQLLDSFFIQIRSFIYKRTFDLYIFDSHAARLQKMLANMIELYERIPPSQMLSQQLKFAKHMFHIMLNSANILERFSDFNIPGHRLVYRLTEMNIWFLVLRDSYGSLNLQVRRYDEKVYNSWTRLCTFERDFLRAKGLSANTHIVFWDQIDQANDTLDVLWGQIPEES